jgi:hypothetical protein
MIIEKSKDDTTDIGNVVFHEPIKVDIILGDITVEDAAVRVHDLSFALEERLQAFELLYQQNPEYFHDILAKLMAMFSFTNTGMLNKYIIAICQLPIIPTMERLETMAQLCLAPKNASLAINLLGQLCEKRVLDIPMVVYVDKLFFLLQFDQDMYKDYLVNNILMDTSIADTIRYSLLVQSKTKVNEEYFKYASLRFLECEIGVRFHIMCCANLLSINDLTETERSGIVPRLVKWMNERRFVGY